MLQETHLICHCPIGPAGTRELGACGMQVGQLYNTEDGRKALRDIFALQLFDNVQIFPRQDQVDQTKVRPGSWLWTSCNCATFSKLQALGAHMSGKVAA